MPKDPDAGTSQSEPDSEEPDSEAAPAEREPKPAATEPASERPKRTAAARKRRRPKQKRPIPRTEEEIDSPKPLTLWLLGVMTSATLVMWGSARLACNYKGDAPKKAPELSTAALARTPKDAAMEVGQRWATYDFAGALELSKAAVAEELKQEKQKACSSDEAACKKKHDDLASKVLTRGVLLSQDSTSALVRVISTLPDGSKTLILRMEPDGAIWKAVERTADTAQKPAP
ncbi:MAG TPA: hypothetical protein VK524_20180 [Polyangiaceae bacterium]|nr:hypothetical protein [Polyangiaceae bacterium]